jgi:phytoene dehydrogenase-like protein
LTLPGFRHDVCSAIHPLAVASPFFRSLELELDLIEPPAAVAHPLDDGTAAIARRSLADTAATLGSDGDAYRRLLETILTGWDEL